MDKERVLAVILVLLAGFVFYLPLYLGLIKDLSDLLTQIVSGAVLLLLAGAVGFWIKNSRNKQRPTLEDAPKTAPLEKASFPIFEIEEKGHDIDIIGGTYKNIDSLAKMGKESHDIHIIDPHVIGKTATPVERDYETATLKFKIWSTTDWIEVGLVDSRHVTINSHSLSKGTVKSVEEPNSSHLRIDQPDSEFAVTATFEVYSGPLFVFTRKGDIGVLKVDVLNKNSMLLFEIPEYGVTDQKYNRKEFGFEFNDWD